MRFVHVAVLLALAVALAVHDSEAAIGGSSSRSSSRSAAAAGKKRKSRKPQADAPVRSDSDQYDEYDQAYYDSKDDYADVTNGRSSPKGGATAGRTSGTAQLLAAPADDDDTTEVYRQPDDEQPTGMNRIGI